MNSPNVIKKIAYNINDNNFILKISTEIAENKHDFHSLRIERARSLTNTSPTEGQIRAGNYKKGKVRWKGFVISIENPRGSERSGVDKDGSKWSVTMKHDYGYFLGYSNSDKEHMDVIIGDYPESEIVFVVNQTKPSGQHDEYKVVIGALSYKDAEKTYLDNYSKGWKNYKAILPMTIDQFKDFLLDINKKYGKPAKVAALNSDVILEPHQEKAIKNLINNNGRGLFAHATGSGKTLTSIAAFERMKNDGKAKKALVVVPSSLRDNFISNISRFTNSKYTVYGSKNEKGSKYIDHVDKDGDYAIISYDMFRKDPDQVMKNTGADTLIVDEIHRSRDENGRTYKSLSENTGKFKNVITLTGSLVNNHPNDIVPLLDVTLGERNNPLDNKSSFEKEFLERRVKSHGFWNPIKESVLGIKNKKTLKKLLNGKVDYIDHKDVEERLPQKIEEIIETPMSDSQYNLYRYSIEDLPLSIRTKIKKNIPVNQSEMQGVFGKLMMARQIMTNPAKYDKDLLTKDITETSPKIKKAIDNIIAHLNENKINKAVVYGNLVEDQLKPVEKALKAKGIDFSTFYGTGHEGNKVHERRDGVNNFMKGDKRVVLLSPAGNEGLDLKGANLLQILEGHYNPEKIQQVEARVRRLSRNGEKQAPVKIQKYVSTIPVKGLARVLTALKLSQKPSSTDQWIYTVANKKDALNNEFREALK